MLSEVVFGSFLVYSPRGDATVSKNSRTVTYDIKGGSEKRLDEAISRLVSHFQGSGLDEVLGQDVLLVPTPRSSVLLPGALWPANLIASKLVEVGLGSAVLPCLERVEAVPKSAFQQQGSRPDARRHYDSMRAEQPLFAALRITLVDDVLTRGATLLAGASRVAEVCPGADVRAFALIRTMGRTPDSISRIIEPCVGRIQQVGEVGQVRRDPVPPP